MAKRPNREGGERSHRPADAMLLGLWRVSPEVTGLTKIAALAGTSPELATIRPDVLRSRWD